MVFSPGSHTFKVAAFNETELIGFDEDIFVHRKSSNRTRRYPCQEDGADLISKIFSLLDTFKQMIV